MNPLTIEVVGTPTSGITVQLMNSFAKWGAEVAHTRALVAFHDTVHIKLHYPDDRNPTLRVMVRLNGKIPPIHEIIAIPCARYGKMLTRQVYVETLRDAFIDICSFNDHALLQPKPTTPNQVSLENIS